MRNGAGYDYQYYLGDNLGNTRVTFGTKTGTVVAYQRDDYYPFGLEISRTPPVPNPKNEYLYNKKELQEELGQYDYGARFYDPVIARWNVVDPLAETNRKWSPYNYVVNNPIRLIDPDGRDSVSSKDLQQYQQVYASNAGINLNGSKQTKEGNISQEPEETQSNGQSDSETVNKDSDDGEREESKKLASVFYNGQQAFWIEGGQITDIYAASSGYPGHQNASFEDQKLGPIPEGQYSINLKPNPDRVAKSDPTTGWLLANPVGGIERIPKYYQAPNGAGYIYTPWGTIRAKLEPNEKNNSFGRSSFYLHDSTKGYTHGCIECENGIFAKILDYRKFAKRLKVIVKYVSKNSSTHGKTDKN